MESVALGHLGALADALRSAADDFIWDPPACDAQQAVLKDEALLQELGARTRTASLLRIWSCTAALVAPRHFARKLGFAAAVENCKIPVVLRSSGGTVVLHGPAFINITLVTTQAKGRVFDIDSLYETFGEVLFRALAQLGVRACFERIPQAYCSGRHDIAVGGRKLAGTAAMMRRFSALDAQLVHATLRLRPAVGEITAITSFERELGLERVYDERFLTSLAEAVIYP